MEIYVRTCRQRDCMLFFVVPRILAEIKRRGGTARAAGRLKSYRQVVHQDRALTTSGPILLAWVHDRLLPEPRSSGRAVGLRRL